MNRLRACFKSLVVILSIAACGAAAAGGTTALNSAASGSILRGHFVQHKHLAELEQPLVSSGHYVLARDRGLLWQVEKPVESTLVITPDALTERSQGRLTAHISAAQRPALGAVASVLLAVFQGDTAQLSQYFNIERRGAEDATLTLTPKTDAVKNFISRLTLSGDLRNDNTGRRIRIEQPGGDFSVIDLSPSDAGPETLTPQEQRAFSR